MNQIKVIGIEFNIIIKSNWVELIKFCTNIITYYNVIVFGINFDLSYGLINYMKKLKCGPFYIILYLIYNTNLIIYIIYI